MPGVGRRFERQKMNATVKQLVYEKLVHKNVRGKYHLSIDTIKRMGWKSHERGYVEQAVRELIREGKLRWYHKGHKFVQLA